MACTITMWEFVLCPPSLLFVIFGFSYSCQLWRKPNSIPLPMFIILIIFYCLLFPFVIVFLVSLLHIIFGSTSYHISWHFMINTIVIIIIAIVYFVDNVEMNTRKTIYDHLPHAAAETKKKALNKRPIIWVLKQYFPQHHNHPPHERQAIKHPMVIEINWSAWMWPICTFKYIYISPYALCNINILCSPSSFIVVVYKGKKKHYNNNKMDHFNISLRLQFQGSQMWN